jgi:hypothetical protein
VRVVFDRDLQDNESGIASRSDFEVVEEVSGKERNQTKMVCD